MSNNDYILEAVKGKPNSLTSIAFNTGATLERQRIIKLLEVAKPEMETDELEWGIDRAIALIKGDNE